MDNNQFNREMFLRKAMPVLYDAVHDLIAHSKKHFPDNLLPAVTECEKILDEVKEAYDRGAAAGRPS